ncbi:MAG: D-alanyl-D-alanine carboxypeptidase [Tenericutes bacterium]|nr:D-alanyl-D-alanine carboxypeptidase [Mycoplasmatota bacterium]
MKLKIKFMLFIMFFSVITVVKADEVDLAKKAKSAILIEASTGEIMWEKNAHEKLAPASMTKMMSMLLVVESIDKGNLKWDQMITVSENASKMGGSQILLETGEQMSVEDLFKGVAVASGNDAVVALGEAIGGSEEMFVKMMNDRAKELGLTETNFKNPHGLDEENHYSSAHDMAMIGKELVKHKKVLEYTGIYEDYLRKGTSKEFWLVNTNKLVRFFKGVDGLKTGYTDTAGYCLTATIEKDGMRLISVVMGEPEATTRSSETTGLINYGFSMYSLEKMLTTSSNLGNAKVYQGENEYVTLQPLKDVSILNNKNKEKRNVTYTLDIKTIKAPVKKGEIVGKLNVIENGKTIDKIDVTVKENVKKATLIKMYLRNLKNILSGSIDF